MYSTLSEKMISIESPQITVSTRTSLAGSKLAVRDSFDDDDLSDDADDEVFIQDGRNGLKHDDDRGVKRPLMPPRRKVNFKTTPFQSNRHRRVVVRALWAPCCYALLFFSIFLIVIGVVVLLTNVLLSSSTPWTQQRATTLLPPSLVLSRPVWNSSLPRILSESNLHLQDVNGDGTPDVLLGYSTAVDRSMDPGFICAMYFHSKYPCYGGVLALDGRSGEVIWQHWTEEGVFALDCSADINGDNTNDCLATGKKGLFCAVNGRDGTLIWHLPASDQMVGNVGDVFSPRFISDVDGDRVQDIVASHTGTSGICGHSARTGLQGHLLVISGASGQVLQCLPTPSHAESLTAPQLLVWPDGGSVLLVGTGGPHTPGGLHVLPLHPQLGMQVAKSRMVYYSKRKGGLLTPALLVDITGDGTEDIVAAMFDSIVVAFDGKSLAMLWNFTVPQSELHSPISAGYYNEDNIPDLLVRFHLGPGFPSYHFTQTQVLDGRTGKPLLPKALAAAPSTDSAPSLSLEGHGNDAFLIWASGCLARTKEASTGPLPPTARDTGEADWDKCDPKFNATSSDLKLITQHIPPPGIQIFHTEETPATQQARLQEDYSAASSYIDTHPDFWDEYASLLCTSESPEVEAPPAPVRPYPPSSMHRDGQEQVEEVRYPRPLHQVRKHGRPLQPLSRHPPYYQPPLYTDYDAGGGAGGRNQEDAGPMYDEMLSRPGRDTAAAEPSNGHKVLSSHLSAGVIAPRLELTQEGVDFIFTSHWSAPKDSVLPSFQRCLANQLSQLRLNRKHSVLSCQRQAQNFAKTCWSEATQLTVGPERPFGGSPMARLTVHRVSLQLQCPPRDPKDTSESPPGQRCAGILPWSLQSLPASPASATLFRARMAGVHQ